MPRITVLFLVISLIVKDICARAKPPRERPTPESVLERFEITKDGTTLLLPVELKGKKFLFALDTVAVGSVYDSSLIPLLGEPIRTEDIGTSDGSTRVQFFQPPDAKLGCLSLRTDCPVIATDLRRAREGSGEEVYGFIGMDFLGKHIVRIDPDRGEVVFLRSLGPDPGRRLPMTMESKIPYVRVKISGVNEAQLFMVDTGCSSGGGTGLMQSETIDVLINKGKIRLTGETLAQSLSGSTFRRRGRVEDISLGDDRHGDLIFSASLRNILGLNYWSRYVTTFDFPDGAIYLKRSSRYDKSDVQDLSGLTLIRAESRTLVADVEKGSAAALADIRPQDLILKANGQMVEKMSLRALRLLFAAKGAKVSLLVGRGGDERQVKLVLPDSGSP